MYYDLEHSEVDYRMVGKDGEYHRYEIFAPTAIAKKLAEFFAALPETFYVCVDNHYYKRPQVAIFRCLTSNFIFT